MFSPVLTSKLVENAENAHSRSHFGGNYPTRIGAVKLHFQKCQSNLNHATMDKNLPENSHTPRSRDAPPWDFRISAPGGDKSLPGKMRSCTAITPWLPTHPSRCAEFRANGLHTAEGKHSQLGLLSKVLRRTRRAPEPYWRY